MRSKKKRKGGRIDGQATERQVPGKRREKEELMKICLAESRKKNALRNGTDGKSGGKPDAAQRGGTKYKIRHVRKALTSLKGGLIKEEGLKGRRSGGECLSSGGGYTKRRRGRWRRPEKQPIYHFQRDRKRMESPAMRETARGIAAGGARDHRKGS